MFSSDLSPFSVAMRHGCCLLTATRFREPFLVATNPANSAFRCLQVWMFGSDCVPNDRGEVKRCTVNSNDVVGSAEQQTELS
jgi:hypothetical protein